MFQYTIMDRGSDTAKILYNTTGFVAHTQSNGARRLDFMQPPSRGVLTTHFSVFGYTGMQGNLEGVFHPGWSDLTQGVAWTLQLLYDHLAYSPTEDLDFFRDVTWPLMKVCPSLELFRQADLMGFPSDRNTRSSSWSFWSATSTLTTGRSSSRRATLPRKVRFHHLQLKKMGAYN